MTVAADKMRSRRQAFAAPGGALDRIVRMLAVGLPAFVGVIAALMVGVTEPGKMAGWLRDN